MYFQAQMRRLILHSACSHKLEGLADLLVDYREAIIVLSSWYSLFSHLKGKFQRTEKESGLI